MKLWKWVIQFVVLWAIFWVAIVACNAVRAAEVRVEPGDLRRHDELLNQAVADAPGGVVTLTTGRYRLDRPLRIRGPKVAIRAEGAVVLSYCGEPVDDFLVDYAPTQMLPETSETISNVMLECAGKIGGARVYNCRYGHDVLNGCQIRHAKGVGVHLERIYGGTIRGLRVQCEGTAVRCIAVNNTVIVGGKLETSGDKAPAMTVEKCGGLVMEAMCFEGIKTPSHPALRFGSVGVCSLRNCRFEAVQCDGSLIEFADRARACTVEACSYGRNKTHDPVHFVRFRRDAWGCSVRSLYGSGVSRSAVHYDGEARGCDVAACGALYDAETYEPIQAVSDATMLWHRNAWWKACK